MRRTSMRWTAMVAMLAASPGVAPATPAPASISAAPAPAPAPATQATPAPTARAHRAAGASTWRTPPRAIADILLAPKLPRARASVSPDARWLLLPELPSLIPLATLAEPVAKLAGLEILPAMHCTRGDLKQAWSGFSTVPIAGGAPVRAQLPRDARLAAPVWAPDGRRLACALYAPGGAELWVVEAATGVAHRVPGVRLNTSLDQHFEWTNDGKSLLALAVVPGGTAVAEPAVPPGPVTRMSLGRAVPQRTARNVLETPADQRRFALETTTQLVQVAAAGGAPQKIGRPAMIDDWQLSPDERHLLVTTIAATPPGFPYELFDRHVAIWTAAGAPVAALDPVPLDDRSAISSVASLGPRAAQWSPDGAVWFFSWQDQPGADPQAAVRDTSLPQPGTDRLMRLDPPFAGAPRTVATSDFQFRAMAFTGDGRRVLVGDVYEPRRHERRWWVATDASGARHVLSDRSTEGVYDQPGQPLMRRVRHASVPWTTAGGDSLWLAGEGFRADGQRPFLDRQALADAGVTRAWESAGDVLEQPQALLDAGAARFVTLRQSHTEPPNWWLRRAGSQVAARLSAYADPAPALSRARRLSFTFTRPDSVRLHAEAVLPADWQPGTRLPTIFWVYPNDYRSAAAAQENRRSPNRFPSQSALNPEVLVTQGYAVVYPDIAVVGTNDRYVQQIQLSAHAAVDECVRQGFCDRDRVGVGGHSYGAFSTANLLAHTRLFRAGVASDGAYNRTLTPFTFQAEERTLWQAKDTYLAMSPFLYADEIEAPLLLMHNLDDTNVGTNPIQSERMFEALSGLGKTAALVQFPFEDHGPVARETVLDYWSRALEWYDRWVKNAGAGPAAGAAPGSN